MHVELITAEALKYKGDCRHVLLPGTLGEMGVLPGHAPLVAMLDPGMVRIDTDKGPLRYAISQGFVTVSGNDVVCLVDAALEPKEIKVEAVQARIAELESDPLNLERNRDELRYLKAQLTLAGSA